jgi:plasmid stabilization system protein ParE
MDFESAKQAQTYIHQQTQILVEEAYHNERALKAAQNTINDLNRQIETLAKHPSEVEFKRLHDEIVTLYKQLGEHREYGRRKDAAKMKVEEKWRAAEQQIASLLDNAEDVKRLQHRIEQLEALNTQQSIEYQALERTILMTQSTAGYIKDQIYNLDIQEGLKKKIKGLDLALEDALQSGAEFQRLYLAEVEKTKRVIDAANGVHDTW